MDYIHTASVLTLLILENGLGVAGCVGKDVAVLSLNPSYSGKRSRGDNKLCQNQQANLRLNPSYSGKRSRGPNFTELAKLASSSLNPSYSGKRSRGIPEEPKQEKPVMS